MASTGQTDGRMEFVPALIVVDMQEDFCPPNGSLAVQEGRSIAPLINSLLDAPGFAVRVATQDFHPPDHISFARNHPPPNNQPFVSFIDMKNPMNPEETKPQQLWPVHCVAGTVGASIIPEIKTDKIDIFIKKGMDPLVEMYSAFADAFGNTEPILMAQEVNINVRDALLSQNVTDVFVVGLAGDYCVKFTAIDAAKVGFRTWVIDEATKCVDPGSGWEQAKEELTASGVSVITANSSEVARVRLHSPSR